MTTIGLAAFTIFLVSLTWIIQTEAKHVVHFRHRRQQKTDCLTSSRTAGRCVPFQDCVIKGGRFPGAPAICRWEMDGPVICCPDESKENSLTCGLSKPTSNPSALRRRRQTTFDDVTETALEETVTFVIGGEDAVMGKWPWMALIYHEDDKMRRSPICGASLISDTALLTAAHCFLGRMNPTFVIRVGEHDLKKSRGVEYKVKKIISHPGFQYPALYDDIAILRLETKVAFTNSISVVCLPKNFKDETFEGKRATVTGWGYLEYGGKRANILQQLEMPIVPNSHCQKRYEGLGGAIKPNLPNGISKKMMCAGYEDKAKDSCQGDSGGPLVYQGSSDNWFQIGIVSAGFDCGSGVPGMYTRVTEYLDWIAENMA